MGLLPKAAMRAPQRMTAVEVNLTEQILLTVFEDLQEIERKSSRYLATLPSDSRSLAVVDIVDLETEVAPVREGMRKIWRERVDAPNLPKRMKWAIYEKRYFDRLLEDISWNLEELEKLFPDAHESQRIMTLSEVVEMEEVEWTGDVLSLIQDVSEECNDLLLGQAINQARERRDPGHTWIKTTLNDEAELHQGNRITRNFGGQAFSCQTGHNYGETIIAGKSRAHQGDFYGYSSRNG